MFPTLILSSTRRHGICGYPQWPQVVEPKTLSMNPPHSHLSWVASQTLCPNSLKGQKDLSQGVRLWRVSSWSCKFTQEALWSVSSLAMCQVGIEKEVQNDIDSVDYAPMSLLRERDVLKRTLSTASPRLSCNLRVSKLSSWIVTTHSHSWLSHPYMQAF